MWLKACCKLVIGFASRLRPHLKSPCLVWLKSGSLRADLQQRGWNRPAQVWLGRVGPRRRQLILMDGPWQLFSVRDLLRVPGSESQAVSAWNWSVHCTITPRWEDILSRLPEVKTLIFSSRAYTLKVMGQRLPVHEQLKHASTHSKNHKPTTAIYPNSYPILRSLTGH